MLTIVVIVPTYNRPEEALECVEALLDSGYAGLTVDMMDQSSDGQTEELLKKVDDRRLRYHHVDKPGKSRAINLAIEGSSSDIIAIMDDDCFVMRGWAEMVIEEFESDPELGVICGAVLPRHANEDAATIGVSVSQKRVLHVNRRNPYGYAAGANIAFRRALIARAGLYDENLGPGAIFKAVEDNEYFYRLLRSCERTLYTPQLICHHKQWRSWVEIQKRLDDYRIGNSAFIGKHLARGDAMPTWYYSKFLGRCLMEAISRRSRYQMRFFLSELRIMLPWTVRCFLWYRQLARVEATAALCK